MNWIDKSDRKSRFFVAESKSEIEGDALCLLVEELLLFTLNILLKEGKGEFDTLFVEVDCGTGRIILSPSTEAGRLSGAIDGCAVRLAKLEDVWYTLSETGVPDWEFSHTLTKRVLKIAEVFHFMLKRYINEFKEKVKGSTLRLLVFEYESLVMNIEM